MPNISKKTAYDVKEASDQSLSKSARKQYAENAQAGSKDDSPMSKYGSHSPMKMGGSFMSKHSQSGFQQAKDLMQDMPIDKHASALNQGKTTTTVYLDRKNQKGQSQGDVFNLRKNQVNKAIDNYKEGSGTKNQYDDAVKAQTKTIDSLNVANKKMDGMFSKMNKKRKDILSGKY